MPIECMFFWLGFLCKRKTCGLLEAMISSRWSHLVQEMLIKNQLTRYEYEEKFIVNIKDLTPGYPLDPRIPSAASITLLYFLCLNSMPTPVFRIDTSSALSCLNLSFSSLTVGMAPVIPAVDARTP